MSDSFENIFKEVIAAHPALRSKILTLITQLDTVLIHGFFRLADAQHQRTVLGFNGLYKAQGEINWNNYQQSFQKVKAYEQDPQHTTLEDIQYPFDVFGTSIFLTLLNHLDCNNFIRHLRQDLIIYVKNNDRNDLVQKIARISLLRHFTEHNGKPQHEQLSLLDGTVVIKQFCLQESLTTLFLFLPDRYAKNLCDAICAATENEELQDAVKTCQKTAAKTGRDHIRYINEKITEAEKKQFGTIKDTVLCETSCRLFPFLKEYRFCGEKNLAHVKGIIKNCLPEDTTNLRNIKNFNPARDDAKKLKKRVNKMLSFEESAKIFDFFLRLNEIFHRYFVYYYEAIKPDKKPLKDLRNNISHSRFLFFYNREKKSSLFRYSVDNVLDFYDHDYAPYRQENKCDDWPTVGQIKSSFLQSLKALCNKKDYLYIRLDKTEAGKGRNVKTVRLSPQQQRKFSKEIMRDTVQKKIEELKGNDQHKTAKISVRKLIWYNFVTDHFKNDILAAKKQNKARQQRKKHV